MLAVVSNIIETYYRNLYYLFYYKNITPLMQTIYNDIQCFHANLTEAKL